VGDCGQIGKRTIRRKYMLVPFGGQFIDSNIIERNLLPIDSAYVTVLKNRILALEEQVRELMTSRR